MIQSLTKAKSFPLASHPSTHPSTPTKASLRALAPSLRFPSFPFPPPPSIPFFFFPFHLHFSYFLLGPPTQPHFSGSPPSPAFFPIFFPFFPLPHSPSIPSHPFILFPFFFPPSLRRQHVTWFLPSTIPSSHIPIISADWVFSLSLLSLDTHLLMASVQSLLDQSPSLTFLPSPPPSFLPSFPSVHSLTHSLSHSKYILT
ncbi:hypothetical protein HOY80DRAFT_423211 [Tuber brumale]|nr:hypothetical protein HOY80DRAFT_423211 [Tuber brumale]